MARPTALLLALAPALLLTRVAHADTPLSLDLVGERTIRIDGIPREWPSRLLPLDTVIRGSRPKADGLEARAALAYDDAHLYVAFDVRDDRLVRTASCSTRDDHASLTLAFPNGNGGYTSHEITLVPGDPGKLAGCVKDRAGAKIAGAKIVEAEASGGYTFEAVIPFSAFPEAAHTRVGLRGALRFHDNDGQGIKTIVGSTAEAIAHKLPALPTSPEQSLKDGLLREWALPDAPAFEAIADVSGDSMNERVLVYDKWLVVLGPGFRGGREYSYTDLGASAKHGQITQFYLRDLTGRGKKEIVLEKRMGEKERYREVFEVLGVGPGDRTQTLFQHEVGIQAAEGRIRNEVRVVADGPRQALEIRPGEAHGFTVDTYREPVEQRFFSMLFPWGKVKSRRYGWNGSGFVKVHEEAQAPVVAQAPAALPPKMPDPRAPSPDELQERVHALYRQERGVGNTKPRFDLAADIAEDTRRERILLHGRDLVVFGQGYKGGSGYSYLTLQQFADEKDILEVQLRDVTGDGKADIIVRGVMKAKAGDEVVERELFVAYAARAGQLVRVFAAETARSIGNKRIAGQLSFGGGPNGATIVVKAGRAIGWDEQSYPFAQDDGPVGGVEPLLLPWSAAKAVTYRFDGSSFVR